MKTVIKKPDAVMLLLGISFMLLSLYFYSDVKEQKSLVRVRAESGVMTAGQLDSYYKKNNQASRDRKTPEEIPDITLWNMKAGLNVSAEECFTGSDFTLIEGYGNLDKILPGHLTAGVYPPKSDTEGCAVSDAGAEELFGSSSVIGKTIRIEDKEYVIRGIIRSEEDIVWVQNADAESFTYIEMQYGERFSLTAAKAWLQNQGVLGAGAIISGGDYAAFNQLFMTLPLWVVFFSIAVRLRGMVNVAPDSRLRMLLFILWLTGLAALVLIGIKLSFRFDLDYLPGRWSDFSFYGKKLEELREAARGAASVRRLPGDIEFIRKSRNCAYCAWGSLIFVSAFCFRARKKRNSIDLEKNLDYN